MNADSGIKVFVFYYKDGTVLETDKIYQPVMAGNKLLHGSRFIKGDDTGEDISCKNPFYSELTGIYWVWKNTRQDVTGTCHYRRFFTAKPEPLAYHLKRLLYIPMGMYKKRYGLIYTRNTQLFAPRILNSEEIKSLLSQYDAILPQARKFRKTVRTQYERFHHADDLDLLEEILKEKYPDYLGAYHKLLESHSMYANNMFVMKDKYFQEFMNWWFDMLFEFERRIDLTRYTNYQQRVMGFVAERLLNVWFIKRQLNCVELPVIYFKRFKLD